MASTYYGGYSPAEGFQTTWVICGSHWDVAETVSGTDGGEFTLLTLRADFEASIQGVDVSLTQTCSSDQADHSGMRTFTVSGDQLTFQQSLNGLTLVSTFNLQ